VILVSPSARVPKPQSEDNFRHLGDAQTPLPQTHVYVADRSMRTLRFLLVTRADRLGCIGGHHALRLSHKPARVALQAEIDHGP